MSTPPRHPFGDSRPESAPQPVAPADSSSTHEAPLVWAPPPPSATSEQFRTPHSAQAPQQPLADSSSTDRRAALTRRQPPHAGPPVPSSPPVQASPPMQTGHPPQAGHPQQFHSPQRSAAPQRPAVPQQFGAGQPPAPSVPPPPANSFVEPGRQSAVDPYAAPERPQAPHLDPRVAGLEQVPTRRRFPMRRAPASMPANPVSNGLELPIHTPRRISVVGMKGGVGKTTMAIMLATAAARARREQVLLLDADTTYGSLMLRMGIAPVASSHDIAQMGDPGSLDVLAGAISRNNDGVWVLPTGRTPAQSAAFGEATYVQAMRAVYRHFPITVSDCGAGMAGTLMQRVISASHSLVIATAPSMDSVLASHNALQWLDSIGYEALARRSIVAIGNVDINNPRIDLAEARQRFAPLCRAVVTIPSDPHLAPGSHLRYDALAAPTVRAAHDLAANVLEAALSVP